MCGVFETAREAAWAKRFEGPTTNASKLNWRIRFVLSSRAVGLSPIARATAASVRPVVGLPLSWRCFTTISKTWRARPCTSLSWAVSRAFASSIRCAL